MAPCGHLAASSHAGRARGPAGEQNTAGANLGISTPGRRGATTGWKEGADAPRLFDANHSVLVLARGAPITKTEEWQEDGQERRTGTETSGGGFPLVQQPLWFHPRLVLLWDDVFSISVKTVWMSLVFNLTEQIKGSHPERKVHFV